MESESCYGLESGTPDLLGATTLEESGTNFAFYAGKDAQRVELCLFDKAVNPDYEKRYDVTAKEPVINGDQLVGHIWHGIAPEIQAGALYGFRVDGAFEPQAGRYFNNKKLLVDPCARVVTHALHQWAPCDFPSNREDNAALMSKARVINWRALQLDVSQQGALYPHADTNILEMHVKGATILHPDIPENVRGTFMALIHPVFLDWAKKMHFTTLELMPPAAYGSDKPLAARGLKNYWGYMPFAPMAPHPTYATNGTPLHEFAHVITTLRHQHGIEVVLDVVPNHTLEGGSDGPMINFRGMDSSLYLPNLDFTGCGNTRDFGHPMNIRFFLDELLFWASLGVAGFRIDLATIIGRLNGRYFDPNSPMMRMIREHPVLHKVKFDGEPYDLGPHGYQVGNLCYHSPAAPAENVIGEWDPDFRDTLTKVAFSHDDTVPRSRIMSMLAGMNIPYYAKDRKNIPPYARVIKSGSHDGPTMWDMISVTGGKKNYANLEGNCDGNDIPADTFWGLSDDRMRVQRFAFTLLALAQGVPMTTMGNERCHSQQGNTNTYCQDSDISYMRWKDQIPPEGHQLMSSAAESFTFKAAHSSLRRATLFTEQADPNSPYVFAGSPMKDVTWLDPMGDEFQLNQDSINWLGGFQMMLSGDPGNSPSSEENPTRFVHREERDAPLVALINPTLGNLEFTLPFLHGVSWTPVLNSAAPNLLGEAFEGCAKVLVGYRSAIVFEGPRTPVLSSLAQATAAVPV
jgi:glycogen operon protein